MPKHWNIQAMESDLPRLLADCRTDFERANVRALHGREIRNLAETLAANGRLTPGGRAIAERYGFRG